MLVTVHTTQTHAHAYTRKRTYTKRNVSSDVNEIWCSHDLAGILFHTSINPFFCCCRYEKWPAGWGFLISLCHYLICFLSFHWFSEAVTGARTHAHTEQSFSTHYCLHKAPMSFSGCTQIIQQDPRRFVRFLFSFSTFYLQLISAALRVLNGWQFNYTLTCQMFIRNRRNN